MTYCCLALEDAVERDSIPIRYIAYKREYMLEDAINFGEGRGDTGIKIGSVLGYCPWCGSKLPKSLSNYWNRDIAIKFYVTKPLDEKELKEIPKEYMTEEWWRKRGL